MRDPRIVQPGRETWEKSKERRKTSDFNLLAHSTAHQPRLLIYTSAATIPTTAGARLYPIRAGRLIRVVANVQTAPTSTMTWNLLKNGTSIFATAPTISNESGSFPVVDDITEWLDNPIFVVGDYFQFIVSTVGAAGGPFVGVIEWMPDEPY